jgi:hypothetical protein
MGITSFYEIHDNAKLGAKTNVFPNQSHDRLGVIQ